MKKVLRPISYFALFILFVSFVTIENHYFISAEGKYSITFPAEYTIERSNQDDFSSEQVQSSFNDHLLFSNANIHKEKLENHESLAKTAYEAFISVMGDATSKQEVWTVKKNKGLKVEFELSKESLKGVYYVVLIKQVQYQFVVLSPISKWDPSVAKNFIKSLEMLR
jgi:hypothetical protein